MKTKDSQRGAAGFKLVIFLLALFLAGHAIYNYLPAAYNAENLRTEMHAAVLQGMSLPPSSGNPSEVTKRRLLNVMKANSIPSYAYLEVKPINNVIQARIAFTQPIPILPFGLYDYNYQFDYSTKAGNYLAKD